MLILFSCWYNLFFWVFIFFIWCWSVLFFLCVVRSFICNWIINWLVLFFCWIFLNFWRRFFFVLLVLDCVLLIKVFLVFDICFFSELILCCFLFCFNKVFLSFFFRLWLFLRIWLWWRVRFCNFLVSIFE